MSIDINGRKHQADNGQFGIMARQEQTGLVLAGSAAAGLRDLFDPAQLDDQLQELYGEIRGALTDAGVNGTLEASPTYSGHNSMYVDLVTDHDGESYSVGFGPSLTSVSSYNFVDASSGVYGRGGGDRSRLIRVLRSVQRDVATQRTWQSLTDGATGEVEFNKVHLEIPEVWAFEAPQITGAQVTAKVDGWEYDLVLGADATEPDTVTVNWDGKELPPMLGSHVLAAVGRSLGHGDPERHTGDVLRSLVELTPGDRTWPGLG